MKIKTNITIKDMVKGVFPSEGEWSYSGAKSKNLERNLEDKQFVRNWTKLKVLKMYPDTDEILLDEYLNSKSFSNLIKKCKIAIIDKQIENSFKNDTGLIVGCILRNNPSKAVIELKRSVSNLLTTYLEMDENFVNRRLEERTEELFEKFSNPKPFSKVGYNPF